MRCALPAGAASQAKDRSRASIHRNCLRSSSPRSSGATGSIRREWTKFTEWMHGIDPFVSGFVWVMMLRLD